MLGLSVLERLWRIGSVLLRSHLQLAGDEADKELARIMRVVALACAALVLFGAAGLVGNALAAVILVEQAQLSWTATLGILLAFDVIVGGLLAVSARSVLCSRGFMEDTRQRAQESLAVLRA